jgi:hypothetical protein
MTKRIILATTGVSMLILLILVFRPYPKPTENNCSTYIGIVADVQAKGGPGDIVIKLSGDNHVYYINRGIDYGLSLAELANNIRNKTVELRVIKHWTPLDPGSHTKHIAQITHQGKVIYSEL